MKLQNKLALCFLVSYNVYKLAKRSGGSSTGDKQGGCSAFWYWEWIAFAGSRPPSVLILRYHCSRLPIIIAECALLSSFIYFIFRLFFPVLYGSHFLNENHYQIGLIITTLSKWESLPLAFHFLNENHLHLVATINKPPCQGLFSPSTIRARCQAFSVANTIRASCQVLLAITTCQHHCQAVWVK